MKIIVTSHGDLCDGILSSYKMLAGENEDIISISLGKDDMGEFQEQLEKTINNTAGEILILCDIYGGTPYNVSYYSYLEQSNRIRIVSGVNLPMVLEAGLSLHSPISLDEIVNVAIEAGSKSIKVAEEISMNEEIEEDIF